MTAIQFSKREQEVIGLLRQGKSNKVIALTLGIANRTVESHLSSIYAKLSVTSRTEAVIKLSDYNMRESTRKVSTVNQGNPQLKNGDTGGKLIRVFYHPYRSRRNSMKVFVRISILVLVAILLITLIVAAFAYLRQEPNSLIAPTISSVFMLKRFTLI